MEQPGMRERKPLLRKRFIGSFLFISAANSFSCYLASIDGVVDRVVGLHKG